MQHRFLPSATLGATTPRFKPRGWGAAAAALLVALIGAPAAAASPPRVAIFNFELLDTSLEGQMNGVKPEQSARVDRLAPHLREALAASGRYIVAPTDAVDARARAQNLQACGGCDRDLAREVGADLSITGQVQKVSNLILNMNIYTRDIATGKIVGVASADMRGNTDEAWARTLDWLIRNRLLAEPAP